MKMLDNFGREVELTETRAPLVFTRKEGTIFGRVWPIKALQLLHPMLEKLKPLRFALRRKTKLVRRTSPRYTRVSVDIPSSDPNVFPAFNNGAWFVVEMNTGVPMTEVADSRKLALGVFFQQVECHSPSHLVRKVADRVSRWESLPCHDRSYRESMAEAGFVLPDGLNFLSPAQQILLARSLLRS